MKKVFFVLVLLALVVIVGFSQSDVVVILVVVEEVIEGFQMFFEIEIVDYGMIEQGFDFYCVFKFINMGIEFLIIMYVKGSCGCIVFIYLKEFIVLGEMNEIKVCYDINCFGKFIKCVILIINVGEEKQMLIIKGEVVKKLEEFVGLFVNEGNMFNNQ